MVTTLLFSFAKEAEENICLEIENEELKTGKKLSEEVKDDIYHQKIIAKFEAIINDLINDGCSELDISSALQMAEAKSKLNGWSAGLFFGHDPNDEEKLAYYSQHTKRPEIFAKKFKPDISKLFKQSKSKRTN